jgi:hypothetical protein
VPLASPDLELPRSTLALAPEDDAAASSRPALPFYDLTSGHDPRPEPQAPAAPFGAIASPPTEDWPAPSPPRLPFQGALAVELTLSGDDEVDMLAPLPFLPFSAPSPSAQAPVTIGDAPQLPIPGAPWSVERAPLVPVPQSGLATMMLSDAPPDPWPQASILRTEAPLPLIEAVRPQVATMGETPKPPAQPVMSLPTHPTPKPPAQPGQGPAVPAALPEAPASPPVTDDPISIAKFAAITAELGELRLPRCEVLGAHGLSDARWVEAEKRWSGALAEEAKRGQRALLEAHDDAFVKAWQAIRGPFDVVDYARLTVATERGELTAVLDAMAIRRTLWMRLKRIYSRRIAADPAFAARVKQALADARRGGAAADPSRGGTPPNPRRR